MVLSTKLNNPNQVMLHIKIMKCHILALRTDTQEWSPEFYGASKIRNKVLTRCQKYCFSRSIKNGTPFERGRAYISTFLFILSIWSCFFNVYLKCLSENDSQYSNILNIVLHWYPNIIIRSQWKLNIQNTHRSQSELKMKNKPLIFYYLTFDKFLTNIST